MSKDLTPNNPSFELVEEEPGGLPAASERGAARMADPFDDEPDGGANLRRYLAAALRYKWLILLLTAVGTAGGFAASEFVSPEYQASATIWIETSGPDAESRGPIRPQELLQASAWVELLRSHMVLDHVIQERRLYLRPDQSADSMLLAGLSLADRFAPGRFRVSANHERQTFQVVTAAGEQVETGSFGDSVGRSLGLRWQPELERFPADRAVEFTVAAPRDVSTQLGAGLGANLDPNGNFLRVQLDGTDPVETTGIINDVIHRYVDVAAELKRARLDELVSILNEQLRYSEDNLRDAEIALEDFRVETATLPSDRSTPVTPGLAATRDPVFDNFFDMRVELEQIRRDADALRAALEDGAAGELSVEALEAVDAVQRSSELTTALRDLTTREAELRALRFRYTDEHPPVERLIEQIRSLETSTIPGMVRSVLTQLSTREQMLEERLAGASAELSEIPPRAIEEARLTRRVAIADNLYTTLQRRYEEARLSAASSIPDLRVLDEATVPTSPTSDPRLQLILLGFAGSLGLGLLGALLRDRTDSRLRYPEQVTHDLGLTIIAGIPNLKKRRGLILPDHQKQAQEAFRALRLNLIHAYGSAGPIILTISSPGPGDGKSFVTSNLARSFADLGRRTVVIDGDVRRGELHHAFDIDRKPGLTDYLRGATEGPIVRPTVYENLFLLPGGSRLAEGPELLSSKAMRDLLMRLRSDFDVVLVDSPPLGIGVDPFALGTLTGNMLVVLRTGETDRQLADAKLELLDRLPIRLLGAVLNGVPRTREYRYYSYLPGYDAEDELDIVESAPALPA